MRSTSPRTRVRSRVRGAQGRRRAARALVPGKRGKKRVPTGWALGLARGNRHRLRVGVPGYTKLVEHMRHGDRAVRRRFLFQILAMGHSQLAQNIGARGPNTAERSLRVDDAGHLDRRGLDAAGARRARHRRRRGRCDQRALLGWIGAEAPSRVPRPPPQSRSAPVRPPPSRDDLGMGAVGAILEKEEAVRGMAPIARLLTSRMAGSAFHGTQPPEHIASGRRPCPRCDWPRGSIARRSPSGRSSRATRRTRPRRAGPPRRRSTCASRSGRREAGRHHEHEGIHRPPDGRRHRGRDRGEGAPVPARAPDPESPGADRSRRPDAQPRWEASVRFAIRLATTSDPSWRSPSGRRSRSTTGGSRISRPDRWLKALEPSTGSQARGRAPHAAAAPAQR